LTSGEPATVSAAVVIPPSAEQDPAFSTQLEAVGEVTFHHDTFRPSAEDPQYGTISVSWRTADGALHSQELLLVDDAGRWRVLTAVTSP
jgi:hypothetical protein